MIVDDADLKLYHYKEPLKKVEDGFGYYGTVTVTKNGMGVQCHICGEVFPTLDHHIRSRHQITTPQYKEKFQLAKDTALVSEEYRQRMIDSSTAYWNRLSEEEKKRVIHFGKKALTRFRKEKGSGFLKASLETKNKRGSCPDQILDKIKEVATKLGRTPSKQEFITELDSIRYIHLIRQTYGTWSNAVRLCGLIPKERSPKTGYRRYTREELIEYLRIFHQEKQRVPSASDCRRGFLPDYQVFKTKFGSFHQARLAAGINEKPLGRIYRK